MIEVYEVLRTKENELARVRREIEALRAVTALLAEPDDISDLQPGPDPHASPLLKRILTLETAQKHIFAGSPFTLSIRK
jgi:hypothetical protein